MSNRYKFWCNTPYHLLPPPTPHQLRILATTLRVLQVFGGTVARIEIDPPKSSKTCRPTAGKKDAP